MNYLLNTYSTLFPKTLAESFTKKTIAVLKKKKPLTIKNGFGIKSVSCSASLHPAYPLEETHDILRASSPEDYVLLEDQGLLGVQFNFSISDRKSLGVKSKSRQLKLLYKVDTASFKTFLNNHFNTFFNIVASGSKQCDIKAFEQTFEGTINGTPFQVKLGKDELNDLFDPNNENYMKAVIYKIFESYSNKIMASNVSDIRKEQIQRSKVVINEKKLEDSYGLVLVSPTANLFADAEEIEEREQTPSSLLDGDPKSRKKIIKKKIAPPGIPLEKGKNLFNVFSSLPISVTVVEDSKNATAKTKFFASETELKDIYARFLSSPGARPELTVPTFNIIIENRLTSFEVFEPSLHEKNDDLPFSFAFYEDSIQYQRIYVQADYLTALLDKVVFNSVRQTHCPRIVYKSVKYFSYERKNWKADGDFCSGKGLTCFDEREFAFKKLILGQNENDFVNVSTNLMFTAQFPQDINSFYRPNRFITCSAFGSQADVVNQQSSELWESLEKGFGDTLVVSDFPFVKLTPAFKRGPVVQTSSQLTFQGLVSNAASKESSP